MGKEVSLTNLIIMDSNRIAIATFTLARSKGEEKLIEETIQSLSLLSIPIVISDSGSPLSFIKKVKKIENVILINHNAGTFIEQIISSHKEAAKLSPHIFFLQTDKLDFAKKYAKKMIDEYTNSSKKGMFIAIRGNDTLQKYPHFQRKQEEFLNYFISDYTGIKGDYVAGPKIYPSSIVKYLDQINEEIGWGVEAFFYVIAKRLNLSFDFFPIRITPPDDIDDAKTSKLYRLKILQWELDGFFKGLKAKLND